MLKLIRRPDIWITLAFFLLMVPAEQMELFSSLENWLLGNRHIVRLNTLELEQTQFAYDEIVIVDTEEQFFEEYGSWPLKRADIAKLTTNLKKLGAKVTAIDFLMDFPNGYDEDPILAEALEKGGNTIIVAQLEFGKDGKFKEVNYPTETLKVAAESGYTNHTLIGNKLSRVRFFPQQIKDHNIWPFAIKTLAMYKEVEPKLENGQLTIGDIVVPLDPFNDLWVDFPSLPPTATFLAKDTPAGISAAEILFELEGIPDDEWDEETEELQEMIRGKIVLVGDTSEVSHDIFTSPIGEVYGIEFLADTITTLMKNAPIRPASSGSEMLVLLILFICFVLVALIPKYENALFFLIISTYTGFGVFTYVYYGVAYSMSYSLIACVLSTVTINLYLFMMERKQKGFIKGAFSQYLSPTVIDQIVANPDMLKLGGEKREMTPFFSDIQGFSTISEGLTPEELVQLLNEYLTAMCDIISSHHGTIDKFEGDAIIAFWGAPLDLPNHATVACYATIEMQKRSVELRKMLREQNRPLLYTRMGLNSGPVVVGNMGSAERMDYTMMGDVVNLAARLEGANKFYKTYSMISGSTYELVKDDVDSRQLDIIRVVGKNEPVPVHELLARKNETSSEMSGVVEQYLKGLKLYQDRNFADAVKEFEKVLTIDPDDGPSQTYVKRCAMFIETPPEKDWDGVFTFTEKG
ncbi:MAG TPA: CHASE2 domain-containing protein [Candidatus Lambdaproteobacteria bacterium]|nr:CHASE2 domain-containing protein [Candidatus Lambdaproteobacteria bacterium]HIN47151.1 CHASE2 domain-containing protein [Deltaproteobacteria bacterium]HIB45938.1 CHASE2 domain-containing protein [Candidatus Lambdaproteobacteria bacterium]HIB92988.1 CHASE2 domain-containing protein [Candidatus Lambdaproteobacteria bacterium]HIO10070.1 CHASE2 domain-containing protein [Deltaproteobacteria bacterium]